MSAFVDKHNNPFMHGVLAKLADDEGNVLMFFHHVSPLAHYEEIPCANLDDEDEVPSDAGEGAQ